MPADRACLTRAVAWSSILTTFVAPASALDDWLPLPTGVVHRIAFGSCAKQWEPQPIWTAVAAVEPDLFVFLGDNIYGDFDGEKPFIPTRESFEADWAKLAAKPELQAVHEHVPFMATWDNHDYGKHDGGAEFAIKQTSKQVFLDFFGEPTASSRRTRPGIYDARVFGPEGRRVQVILLDNRWFRGPLDIDWEAEPAPEIILQARDVDGRIAFEHRVSLDALRP